MKKFQLITDGSCKFVDAAIEALAELLQNLLDRKLRFIEHFETTS